MSSFQEFIIDTDVGNDDLFCITLLLDAHRAGKIFIRGFTVVSGVSTAVVGVIRLRHFIKSFNLIIPVYKGHHERLGNGHYFNELDWWRERYELIEKEIIESEEGKNVIKEEMFDAEKLLNQSNCTLICLGPLTNVATFANYKTITDVVMMGGILDGKGNAPNESEWNFYADPVAANIVIESLQRHKIPTLIIGLEVSNENIISRDDQLAMIGKQSSIIDRFGFPLDDRAVAVSTLLRSLIIRSPFAVAYDTIVAMVIRKDLAIGTKSVSLSVDKATGKLSRCSDESSGLCYAMNINEKEYKKQVASYLVDN